MQAKESKSEILKEEESKISSEFSNLNIKENPEKSYLLVSEIPEDWKFVVDNLQPALDQGSISLDTVINCIKTFNNKFDPSSDNKQYSLTECFLSLDQAQKSELENHVFPTIFKLILETPHLFPSKLPLLVQWESKKITLSKRQCACLLSHMFMCTTIQQDSNDLHPIFDFSYLFSQPSHVSIQKIRCILNYFTRISKEIRSTSVVFERLVQNESHGYCTQEGWTDCSDVLVPVQIRPQGKIEDAEGAIEADFANKYLGGGVLSRGAVQEEIMFTVCPELIVGVLFFEVMADNEAILMKGAETYSTYTGYAGSFCFKSDYIENSTVVKDNILDREIVAIDAIDFNEYDPSAQFSKRLILRELNKAYIGFFGDDNKKDSSTNKPISTGKWGCGAFRGDAQLKFILQWLACSRANREMLFYSFGDSQNFKDVESFLERYKTKKVGELVRDLLQYFAIEDPLEALERDPNLFKNLTPLN